jgi:hypothetical protein
LVFSSCHRKNVPAPINKPNARRVIFEDFISSFVFNLETTRVSRSGDGEKQRPRQPATGRAAACFLYNFAARRSREILSRRERTPIDRKPVDFCRVREG